MMLDQFFLQVSLIWRELSNNSSVPVETAPLIRRAAERFRQEGQPLQNAVDVLTAIIPTLPDGTVSFANFARFMAMFGPERTIMLKIASLLQASQKTGQWLYFNTEQPQFPPIYGAFDPTTPNCLVLTKYDNVSRIWNFPTVDAVEGMQYLMDDLGRMYSSWVEYFTIHPVRQPYGVGFA
jgi:hypothetical protein